jgi:hypothetical protein
MRMYGWCIGFGFWPHQHFLGAQKGGSHNFKMLLITERVLELIFKGMRHKRVGFPIIIW